MVHLFGLGVHLFDCIGPSIRVCQGRVTEDGGVALLRGRETACVRGQVPPTVRLFTLTVRLFDYVKVGSPSF